MEKIKRVMRVLIFLFVVAIFLNIGHYGGKCFNSANMKLLSGNGRLDPVETIIIGPWKTKFFNIGIPSQQLYQKRKAVIAVSMFLWPVGVLFSAIGWLIIGVCMIVSTGGWFFFKGGFFQLLVKLPFYIYAPIILLGLALFAYLVKKRLRKKQKTGVELNRKNSRL